MCIKPIEINQEKSMTIRNSKNKKNSNENQNLIWYLKYTCRQCVKIRKYNMKSKERERKQKQKQTKQQTDNITNSQYVNYYVINCNWTITTFLTEKVR